MPDHPSIFTPNREKSIANPGEAGLIRRLRDWLGDVSPPSPTGIGDDCAVVDFPGTGRQLLTVDTVNYGHHFDGNVAPELAGRKLIHRNLSDIAAMGGYPGPALLALLAGPDLSQEWLKHFIGGVRDACSANRVAIVGGDISSLSPGNFAAILSLSGSAGIPRLRHGAAAGDWIYVTGSLGGSILGKHVHFEARLGAGQWIAQFEACKAMIDLTDGLAKDMPAIVPDGCCAAISVDRIPVSEAARQMAEQSGKQPLEHAFVDGEDYELLFALDKNTSTEAFEAAWPARFPQLNLSRIGNIELQTGAPSPLIDADTREAIPWLAGFEHFMRG